MSAKIIFTTAECCECGKDIPAFSIAVVYEVEEDNEPVAMCVECDESIEAGWRDLQEAHARGEI